MPRFVLIYGCLGFGQHHEIVFFDWPHTILLELIQMLPKLVRCITITKSRHFPRQIYHAMRDAGLFISKCWLVFLCVFVCGELASSVAIFICLLAVLQSSSKQFGLVFMKSAFASISVHSLNGIYRSYDQKNNKKYTSFWDCREHDRRGIVHTQTLARFSRYIFRLPA